MIHSETTKTKISETLKAKGCVPPWQMSPCTKKGYKRIEVIGEEAEQRRLQALLIYNGNKVVSKESRLKMSEAKKGGKNVGWKGGVTAERQQEYNTLETKAWRKAVFQRDNYRCRQCDNPKGINAHHVKEISQYPELRFDIDNGMTLCLDCHKQTPSYGGKWPRARMVRAQ